jgi:hypothetical protein
MDAPGSTPVEIRALRSSGEAETCAAMMAGSEPWITLRRDYVTSLRIVSDPTREVYLALSGDEVAGFVILTMQGAFPFRGLLNQSRRTARPPGAGRSLKRAWRDADQIAVARRERVQRQVCLSRHALQQRQVLGMLRFEADHEFLG